MNNSRYFNTFFLWFFFEVVWEEKEKEKLMPDEKFKKKMKKDI